MILDEVSKDARILKLIRDGLPNQKDMPYRERCEYLVSNVDECRHVPHGSTEAIDDAVVQRVTKDSVHPFLRLKARGEPTQSSAQSQVFKGKHYTPNVTAIYLADTEHSSSLRETLPEFSGDVFRS